MITKIGVAFAFALGSIGSFFHFPFFHSEPPPVFVTASTSAKVQATTTSGGFPSQQAQDKAFKQVQQTEDWKNSWTPTEKKMSSDLVYLTQQTARGNTVTTLPSGATLHTDSQGRVCVEVIAASTQDATSLSTTFVGSGGSVNGTYQAEFSGYLPINQISSFTAQTSVRSIRLCGMGMTSQ